MSAQSLSTSVVPLLPLSAVQDHYDDCCHGKDILRYADSSNVAHSFTHITLQDKLWVVLGQYYSFHIDY